jgi:hypothetical protein
MGPEDDDDSGGGGGGGAAWAAYRSGSESYIDSLRGYAATPSGPAPPSLQLHPGKGQCCCALCGRWFCRSIKDTKKTRQRELSAKYEKQVEWKMMGIYKDGRAGLRGPLPPVIHGVLSPERRCRRQKIPGWPSGHGATRCGHFVNGDLSKDGLMVSAMTRELGLKWRWLRTGRFCFLFERPDAV